MSFILKQHLFSSINEEIQAHDAWHPNLSGTDAEALIKNKPAGTYLLRKGEDQTGETTAYYITFLHEDGTIRHQPFLITDHLDGSWSYLNGGPGGPFFEASINDVLHLMTYTKKEALIPLVKK